jgi:hypothetical protein
MKHKSTDKPFILQISLLYSCLMVSVLLGKSQESVSTVLHYISKADVMRAAPMLVQMLNKWYFIGF